MLQRLEGAQFYIDSHDDDSLIFEARDAAPARALFVHALERLVAEASGGATREPDPGGPHHATAMPEALVEEIWAAVPRFACRVVEAPGKADRVRIAIGEQDGPGSAGGADMVPRYHLDYDLRSRGWALRYH